MTGMIQPLVRRIASSTSSDQRHAEGDVPGVRRGVAVGEVVAALDQVDHDGDRQQRGQPVPPHDAVAEALGHRKHQEATGTARRRRARGRSICVGTMA